MQFRPPSFETLFQKNEIQKIQDAFAHATGVSSIITDSMGNPITQPSNFTRLCKDIIRKTETGLANCMESDALLGSSPDGPVLRDCLGCGLLDAGVSINVGGHHIANWLVGQVRNEKTDLNKTVAYADEIGVDKALFKSALDEVPAMSMDRFEHIVNALFLMVTRLSEQAYDRFQLEQVVQEKESAENELKKQNEYMASLHETALGMFSRRTLGNLLNSIIKRAVNLTGISNGFILIHTPEDNLLEIKAATGEYTPLIGLKLSSGEGICGKVWETGEPIIIQDYQSWAGKRAGSNYEFVTSVIGVPMTSGSRIEGTIGLSHHETGKTIDIETLDILEQFAQLATIAIDNAKLFESLKKELDQRVQLENEQKEMEARLRQSQKMEAIGTLAGGIAHDFNNILFPVIGFSEMIMEDLPKESPIREQVQFILTGAYRARDLVTQILTFSRQSEQEYLPLKIRLILKEALQLARATLPSTIKIQDDLPRDIGRVMADPTHIHQVAMNLITNAMHAMEKNGGVLTVRLFAQEVSQGNGPVPDMTCGTYNCLEVTDTGCGMTENTVKRIFEPYFTSKPKGKGTGLGLAVVHGIVKNLHGEIHVRSSPGKGSTFFVYLPQITLEDSMANIDVGTQIRTA